MTCRSALQLSSYAHWWRALPSLCTRRWAQSHSTSGCGELICCTNGTPCLLSSFRPPCGALDEEPGIHGSYRRACICRVSCSGRVARVERTDTEPGCWLGRKATHELMCGPERVSEQVLSRDAAGKPKLEAAVALSPASILDIKAGCAAFPKEPSSERSGLLQAQMLHVDSCVCAGGCSGARGDSCEAERGICVHFLTDEFLNRKSAGSHHVPGLTDAGMCREVQLDCFEGPAWPVASLINGQCWEGVLLLKSQGAVSAMHQRAKASHHACA